MLVCVLNRSEINIKLNLSVFSSEIGPRQSNGKQLIIVKRKQISFQKCAYVAPC